MCVKDKCCCYFSLVRGVEIIAISGLIFTLLYVILSVIGGKDIFIILSFYSIHYVYVAIVFCFVTFLVHFLLWQGARQRQRYKFLPFLVFIMIKSLALTGIMVTLVRGIFDCQADKCEPSVEFRIMSIFLVIIILAIHIYFWVVVYTLYTMLSARNEAYMGTV